MENITLILMGAGSSSRFRQNCKVKKQWLRIGDKPLWLFVAERFKREFGFEKIIITADPLEQKYMQSYCDYTIVCGGKTRQESLKNALKSVDTEYVLVSDIARACVDKDSIKRVLDSKGRADCIVPSLSSSDTVVYKDATIEREQIRLIQTPQLSKTKTLKIALSTDALFTDESSAIKASGGSVLYVEGSQNGHKLTNFSDLQKLGCLKAPSSDMFVGNGFDVHGFEEGKKMVLGGVEIESPFGFKAHSDGDVAIHSLIDALLGAIGGGDIGEWFPDSKAEYKDADSRNLLQIVTDFVYSVGYEIVNVDITLLAETPRVSSYKEKMRASIGVLLDIPKQRVNIKATTTEKLGFVGRREGVAVVSVVSLRYYDWTKYEDSNR